MQFEAIAIDESPGDFHQRQFAHEGRTLWVPTLTNPPTLVLGSSQTEDSFDLDEVEAQGLGLTSRRSGGGAVLVGPEELVWFDVVLPVTDPLWHSDIRRSFDWLGSAVQRALTTLGVETELHQGPLVDTEWSRDICFAGLGPGELTIDGKKVVGMSQRRVREAARIQVAILLSWDGPAHARLLKLDPDTRERAATELESVASGLPHSPKDILNAVFLEINNAG